MDQKDLLNPGVPHMMEMTQVSGGTEALSRSPTGTTTRAIAAVWNGGSLADGLDGQSRV